ncbi:sodium-dependent glucose transporter 1-like [Perognathus longimembris pacificus]|uniref:sodium-dependent glucose transporter 1-like n=1 Tax=Perognathus longimembris pacificus TaxID=214514 RepID=UPI002018B295|nr:sodium-dependent glucose transporter 1-like [Perognathus longimembris pacificus]
MAIVNRGNKRPAGLWESIRTYLAGPQLPSPALSCGWLRLRVTSGISASILGPTFQDLATNVNCNISSLSEIFVGCALGYLCGSVIGGVLFDCMNYFLLLGLSMWAIIVSSYLIPFCKTVVVLKVMMSAIGVSFGVLDTALAIFFAACLRPATMIVLSNLGSLASSLFLVLFDKSPLCLWIATSVYGASMATTFPSGVSWIEQYTTISGKSAAFILIGAALGLMATPALTGILQGQYPDLPVVLYACFGSAIFTAILFPMMYKVATLPLGKENRKGEYSGL